MDEHCDGSDNVYRDLGFDHPEEWATKARMATKIFGLIEKRGLTQLQAGAILGVAQGRVSAAHIQVMGSAHELPSTEYFLRSTVHHIL